MTINYPKHHRKIVNALLEGQFLLYSDYDKFQSLKEHEEFYRTFFEESFGYTLEIRSEFAYLISEQTDEKLSRKVTIFLAILCYELGQKTSDLKGRMKNDTFDYQEVEQYLKSETFEEVVTEMNMDDLRPFLNSLARRNIIRYTDKSTYRFAFTEAINLFFEFAIGLYSEMKED
mgnify:CR=1 FL=1